MKRQRSPGVQEVRSAPATFHTKAWLVWLVSSVLIVNVVENPLLVPIVFGALAAVAGTFAVAASEARSFGTLLRIGLVLTVVRVVLFSATGHTGHTTLFTTPEVHLPPWLGDLRLGGAITGEVALQSGLEGLRLAAFLACLGAFLAVTDLYRVLRLLPRFLTDAGLVVTIALAFIPTMFRVAVEIRDAQRMRGHRVRRLRSMGSLAVPVLASGLERSVTLAESMDVRGYGRRVEGAARMEAWARVAILVGTIAVATGVALLLFDRVPASASATTIGVGVALLAGGLGALSRVVPRTRMRRERWGSWDWAVAASATLAAVGAVALRRLDPSAIVYYPYPRVFWPSLDPRATAVTAAIVLPAILGYTRRTLLRRTERRHPQGQPFGREVVGARR